MFQHMVSTAHGPENAAVWTAANQPKPGAGDPILGTTPAAAQDCTDDGPDDVFQLLLGLSRP